MLKILDKIFSSMGNTLALAGWLNLLAVIGFGIFTDIRVNPFFTMSAVCFILAAHFQTLETIAAELKVIRNKLK